MPDNTKTAVTRACRYDPDLNPTYQEFAGHYGMDVVPARPYKPRDKAKVESGVQVVQRWIVAALRNRKFFSLQELNQAIGELLLRLNQRPFRKREGSRAASVDSDHKTNCSDTPRDGLAGILPIPTAMSDGDVAAVVRELLSNPIAVAAAPPWRQRVDYQTTFKTLAMS